MLTIDDFIKHEKEKLKRFRNYWKAMQISKDAEYLPSSYSLICSSSDGSSTPMDYVDWIDQYDVFVSDILDHSKETDDV